jgi:hypothetical protein
VGSISRKWIKQTSIAERCSLQAITEVAREFIADNVVPQMIICSPRVRPGKFVFSDAKRLLQQYRHLTEIPRPPSNVRCWGAKADFSPRRWHERS